MKEKLLEPLAYSYFKLQSIFGLPSVGYIHLCWHRNVVIIFTRRIYFYLLKL